MSGDFDLVSLRSTTKLCLCAILSMMEPEVNESDGYWVLLNLKNRVELNSFKRVRHI